MVTAKFLGTWENGLGSVNNSEHCPADRAVWHTQQTHEIRYCRHLQCERIKRKVLNYNQLKLLRTLELGEGESVSSQARPRSRERERERVSGQVRGPEALTAAASRHYLKKCFWVCRETMPAPRQARTTAKTTKNCPITWASAWSHHQSRGPVYTEIRDHLSLQPIYTWRTVRRVRVRVRDHRRLSPACTWSSIQWIHSPQLHQLEEEGPHEVQVPPLVIRERDG